MRMQIATSPHSAAEARRNFPRTCPAELRIVILGSDHSFLGINAGDERFCVCLNDTGLESCLCIYCAEGGSAAVRAHHNTRIMRMAPAASAPLTQKGPLHHSQHAAPGTPRGGNRVSLQLCRKFAMMSSRARQISRRAGSRIVVGCGIAAALRSSQPAAAGQHSASGVREKSNSQSSFRVTVTQRSGRCNCAHNTVRLFWVCRHRDVIKRQHHIYDCTELCGEEVCVILLYQKCCHDGGPGESPTRWYQARPHVLASAGPLLVSTVDGIIGSEAGGGNVASAGARGRLALDGMRRAHPPRRCPWAHVDARGR